MNAKEEKGLATLLVAASFVGQLTINMVNLSLVYYLRYTLSLDASLVGFAASTYTGVYLVCNLLFGSFYQRFRPYKMIATSLAGMAASALLVRFTSSVPLIFVLLISYGFFMSMLWPQIEAWLTRGAEGKRLNSLTSSFNFAWSFGTGLSPYVTSFFVAFSPSFSLSVAAALFLATSIVVLAVSCSLSALRASESEREHSRQVEKEEKGEDHSTVLRYDSWLALFILYSALSVVLNIFPMYAGEGLGLSERTSGFLLLLRGFATCFFFVHIGRTSYWQFKLWLIYLCEGAFVVLTLLFCRVERVALLGLYLVLFGILFAFSYSFSLFHSAAGAINRGRRMVIHECVLTVGQVIGSSFGGTIYERLGYSDVLIFLSLLALVLLVIQLFVWFFFRRKNPQAL